VPLTPQSSTQASGSAQDLAQASSAFPHSSTHDAAREQAPTTQGTHAPPLSHTSPAGQGHVMPPQLSLQLVLSEQDGTHRGAFAALPPHPTSATAPAMATAPRRDLLLASNLRLPRRRCA
jgi:hypothetical protein